VSRRLASPSRRLKWAGLAAAVLFCGVLAGAPALRHSRARPFLERGQLLLKCHQYGPAVEAFTQTLSLDPACWEAYQGRGVCSYRQGGLAAAEYDWRHAVATAPAHDYQTRVSLGSLLFYLGQPADGEGFFRQAIAAAPHRWETHWELARRLVGSRMLDKAVAEIRAALLIVPDNTEVRLGLAWVLYQKGDLAQAEAEFVAIIRAHPDMGQAWSGLGTVQMTTRRMADAERSYRRAAKLDPASAQAYMGLAWALGQQRRYEAAAEAGEKAVRLDPTMTEAHNNLAVAYYGLGRYKEAWREAKLAGGSADPGLLTALRAKMPEPKP
jgi:tetratricopeptide (TPR) repeat protein